MIISARRFPHREPAQNLPVGQVLKTKPQEPPVRHYFVDEAGDSVLFGRRRKVLIGQEGCSRFFMLGNLQIAEPQALEAELVDLRAELLADPTIRGHPFITSASAPFKTTPPSVVRVFLPGIDIMPVLR